jgi:hypothetical protein
VALNLKAIEDAVLAWVRAGSSYADDKVILEAQGGSAPVGDYIAVKIGGPSGSSSLDEVRLSTDLTQVGQEVEQLVIGQRELGVSVKAFTSKTTGDSSGSALLGRVKTAIGLPSVRGALIDAGLGVTDVGDVQDLSTVFGAEFEGRALLEVRFHVVDTASERTGYIETVNLTDLTGPPAGTSGMDT